MIDKQTLVEQQDSLLEFPCDFPIKVMGASIPHFAETIGAAVRELVPDFDPKTINERKSNGGKYTALTVTVHATLGTRLRVDLPDGTTGWIDADGVEYVAGPTTK